MDGKKEALNLSFVNIEPFIRKKRLKVLIFAENSTVIPVYISFKSVYTYIYTIK